ncbi:tetratricopeptide repeat protein, partial [Microbispora rosea]|uniref:tetratricopeptide repeat protein n=1 Tax=Microbispora rosea TaxID=58117 RepID=UPI0034496EF2
GLASTLNNLAVQLGESFRLRGDSARLDEAQQAVDEALGIYRELAARDPDAYLPGLASTLNNLAVQLGESFRLRGDSARLDEAQQAADEALGIYRELAARDPDAYLPGLASTLNNLAIQVAESGRLDEGHQLAREALALHQTLAERDPDAYLPDLGRTLDNLAYVYVSAGRLDKALPLFQGTLSDRERVLGPDHPDTLASRNNLAYAYEAAGRLDEAIPLYQHTLTDRERVL